ncbi:hypothetical protein HF086_017250 [Spodoptera exigua]|uniref:Uncharacterized protein n=1 Tax=Spodoptera exigua TaxID=7107 RepID=A0A922MVC4_SPOEX|nr:hypothetical protein HF086_017250 [Spodoptera exigua]
MKLNLFKRSMIFATFFGSCLCIALIVASLGTTHWIDARARKTSNLLESEGRISFGLFEGRKELNPAYGWRIYDFSVLFSLGAIAVWLTEYFLRLQHNVMSDEDLANRWSSDDTADLGLSFW